MSTTIHSVLQVETKFLKWTQIRSICSQKRWKRPPQSSKRRRRRLLLLPVIKIGFQKNLELGHQLLEENKSLVRENAELRAKHETVAKNLSQLENENYLLTKNLEQSKKEIQVLS